MPGSHKELFKFSGGTSIALTTKIKEKINTIRIMNFEMAVHFICQTFSNGIYRFIEIISLE